MKLRPILSTAAVERVGRTNVEYRATRLTNRLASTFSHWQAQYLKHLGDYSDPERFGLGLLLTMTLCERDDLLGIERSGEIYISSEGPTLGWMRPDGRRGARALSTLVTLTCGPDFDPRCGGQLLQILRSALVKLDPSLAQSEDALAGALACNEAWCFLALPQFLFAHVTGDLPMTPLPRSAYARLESRLALATHFIPGPDEEDDALQALEGFFHSSASDSSRAVLDDILESTKMRDIEDKTDQQLRDDLAAIWRGKIDAAESAGPLTSLQLGCALYLAARGEHKPATIVGYIKDGSPVVHEALAGCELIQLSSEQLSERLAAALEKVNGQKRINAKAYVGHLWRFASQSVDVEPLLPSLLPDIDLAPVDANVIWPHEGELMDRWLDGPQRDPELARQTRLVRRLMGALKARAAEIFFLQIRNVHIHKGKDYVDVEIVFRGRLHGLKSKDGQRIARVHGALAAELLAQDNLRRIEHKGLGAHLLFGTKSEPNRVYRLGTMHGWLNRAAKQATGDPSSCCHHFRHGAIDATFAGLSLAQIEEGALEQLRIDAGHLSLRSTQRSYLHRFTTLLKDATEEALSDQHKLSDTSVSRWTGVGAANVRQRLVRERRRATEAPTVGPRPELETASAWYWQCLRGASLDRHFARADAPFVLCCPLPPAALAAARPWTVRDMIGFLDDLQSGITPLQAARQRRLPPAVGQSAVEQLLELGQHRLVEGPAALDVVLTSPAAALAALGVRVAAAYQPKHGGWLDTLAKGAPAEFPDAVWLSWQRSTRGRYVKLAAAHRPDRWLGHILRLGMPASKVRICLTTDDWKRSNEIRNLVRAATHHAAGSSVMYETCTYNDRRGHAYVLVAQEVDVLTDHTGAAFSPAGLKSIVLAMRLSAESVRSLQEKSK